MKLLSSAVIATFLKEVGLRPARRWHFDNGGIACELAAYPLYTGSLIKSKTDPGPTKSCLTLNPFFVTSQTPCRSGEIGRRTGLKIPRGRPRVGSIPTSGTINNNKGLQLFGCNPLFTFGRSYV